MRPQYSPLGTTWIRQRYTHTHTHARTHPFIQNLSGYLTNIFFSFAYFFLVRTCVQNDVLSFCWYARASVRTGWLRLCTSAHAEFWVEKNTLVGRFYRGSGRERGNILNFLIWLYEKYFAHIKKRRLGPYVYLVPSIGTKYTWGPSTPTLDIRRKKINCLFPVTCQKILGSVGRQFFFSSFFY